MRKIAFIVLLVWRATRTPNGLTMLSTPIRRVLAAIFLTLTMALATVALGVAPAQAAASGHLQVKGTGTTFSKDNTLSLGVKPGSTKTWYFKIVNTSATAEQFKVIMGSASAVTAKLYDGSTLIPSNTYYTPFIAAGGSRILNVKITVAADAPHKVNARVQFTIRDPGSDSYVDDATAIASITHETGISTSDLFLRTGSQPYIGGSGGAGHTQSQSSSAVKVGNTASFALRLKNNGDFPGSSTLSGGITSCTQMKVTIKQGTTDVTAAVRAGTYTITLAPGAKRDLTASIKLTAATSCTGTHVFFQVNSGSGSIAHVPVAAS